MTASKIMMQFGSAQFSAEGAEAFINKMFERWSEMLNGTAGTLATSVLSSQKESTVGSNGASQKLEYFENVFDEIDGKLKIIAHMPGSNKAEKTRNTALAALFGNHMRGQQTTSADDIREHCQDQGCFDSSNFASHLKGLKDKIAMNTKSGGGYDVKLTAPGRKAAQTLVENLNNEAA